MAKKLEDGTRAELLDAISRCCSELRKLADDIHYVPPEARVSRVMFRVEEALSCFGKSLEKRDGE